MLVLLALCTTMLSCARATNISFASVFMGESVVLQLGSSRVWGAAAAPGASVDLLVDGNLVGNAIADSAGRWEVPVYQASPSWRSVIEARSMDFSVTTTARFGHVFLCSGQSNMQLNLVQLVNGTAEAAAAGALT